MKVFLSIFLGLILWGQAQATDVFVSSEVKEKAKGVVEVEEGRLRILLKNENFLEFLDFQDPLGKEGEIIHYRVEDVVEPFQLILISENRQKSKAYFLINLNNGVKTRILHPPAFSPEGTKFAVLSSETKPPTVEIWRVEPKKFWKETLYKGQKKMKIYEMAWSNEDHLILSLGKKKGFGTKKGTGILTYTFNAWELTDIKWEDDKKKVDAD